MPMFKTLPMVKEAIQLRWENWEAICAFVSEEAFGGGVYLDDNGQVTLVPHNRIGLWLNTREGRMLASHGDWIIRGLGGEFYACKPDIFERTYERA